MVKIVTLFLIVVVALALFGKLRLPGAKPGAKPGARLGGKTCPSCGRPRIGRGPCPCKEE